MKSLSESEALSWKQLALSHSKNKSKMPLTDKFVNFEISRSEEIADFFRSLMKEKQLNFHVDTPFEDYVGKNSIPIFKEEECIILNKAMEACITYCQNNQLDIYEIGLDVFNEFLK